MWREVGYFLPLMIFVWPTRPPSAYSGTRMIGRKLDNVWKQSFYFPRRGCLFVLKKEKNNVEDHYVDKRILLEGFSSIRTMAQRTFLLKNKFFLVCIPK